MSRTLWLRETAPLSADSDSNEQEVVEIQPGCCILASAEPLDSEHEEDGMTDRGFAIPQTRLDISSINGQAKRSRVENLGLDDPCIWHSLRHTNEDSTSLQLGEALQCVPPTLRPIIPLKKDAYRTVDVTRLLLHEYPRTWRKYLPRVEKVEGMIGIYDREERKKRLARFVEKRNARVWTREVQYDSRKLFADKRVRVRGRFVRRDDEIEVLNWLKLT